MRITKNAAFWLVAYALTVLPASPAGAVDTAQDLAAVIALQGKPCGQVVSFDKLAENDYLAHCASGDVYRVYVNEESRVVVEKR